MGKGKYSVKFRVRRVFLRDELWRRKLFHLPSKNPYFFSRFLRAEWTGDCTFSSIEGR
jgi:hypothetical protein